MNESPDIQEPLRKAESVNALNKYYPTAILDSVGSVLSEPTFSVSDNFTRVDFSQIESVSDFDGNSVILREAGHNVGLDQCQDYALISVDENTGERCAVLADGISCTIAGQSVANILCHFAIEGLRELKNTELDAETAEYFFMDAWAEVLKRFDLDNLKPQLAAAFEKHFAKERSEDTARNGHYGGSTLSFMREKDGKLEVAMLGTGAFLVFREGYACFEYGDKSTSSGQINIGMVFRPEHVKFFSIPVQPGDIAVMISDGMIRGFEAKDCRSFVKDLEMARDEVPMGATFMDVLKQTFRNKTNGDDKTMIILKIPKI